MKTQRNLLALAFSLLLLGGCEESTTSPCIECSSGGLQGQVTESVEHVFDVSDVPTISVDNFAGRVTLRPGEPGVVRVKAIRRVERRSHLQRIEILMNAADDGLQIISSNPDELRRASVDFEITAPARSTPRLFTAVGDVEYEGSPRGHSRFGSAVGSIRLQLPEDVNVSFELHAAVGSIHLQDPFGDDVRSEQGVVRGVLGTGEDGHVVANAVVGSVRLCH